MTPEAFAILNYEMIFLVANNAFGHETLELKRSILKYNVQKFLNLTMINFQIYHRSFPEKDDL